MANVRIALDAGHGKNTSGKRTPDGIREWTLNDKVRDYVVANLKGYNCDFIFPDRNEGGTDESLSSRVSYYISKGADVVVSLHHNANTGKWNSATGVETYVDRNCTAADMELAKLIQSKLAKYTGLKNRGVKKANFQVINQNKIPAVLTEGGFMDGRKDYKVITSESGQKAYARAVSEALIEFCDLKKVGTTTSSTASSTTTKKTPAKKSGSFKVKFKTDMNVRSGAGTKYKKTSLCKKGYAYTITKTKTISGGVQWGKLKSGVGWVCIHSKYCSRV